jgi:hypothetical protein
MVQITIRCHPRVPISSDELERWLEQQVDALRAEAPQGTIRLSRLTQGLPSSDVDIGWLLELELPEEDPLLERNRLAESLRDMRLLGLQPTLLAPLDLSMLPRSEHFASLAIPGSNGLDRDPSHAHTLGPRPR